MSEGLWATTNPRETTDQSIVPTSGTLGTNLPQTSCCFHFALILEMLIANVGVFKCVLCVSSNGRLVFQPPTPLGIVGTWAFPPNPCGFVAGISCSHTTRESMVSGFPITRTKASMRVVGFPITRTEHFQETHQQSRWHLRGNGKPLSRQFQHSVETALGSGFLVRQSCCTNFKWVDIYLCLQTKATWRSCEHVGLTQ